ncbi:hypothetical protein KY359_00480, partial [Candidatus Woesearchaeota archaeon]|nr:hypothetical protein [Candidatus Woesearchaeota archaeon]
MTIDETMRQMTRRSSLRLILAGGASIILPSCFLDSRGLATGGPDSPWEVDGGSEPAPPYNPPESDAGTDGDADGDADGADGGCGYTSEELPERVFNVLPVDQNYTGRLDEHLRNQTIPETGKTIRELSALADSAGTKYSASSLADLYRSEPYDAEHDLRQAIYDDFHDLNGHADELLCGRTDEETVRATIDELFDQIFDDGSLQTNYELLD